MSKRDATLRSVPIIAVTSYALSGEEKKARAAGCDDYVPKPFSPRQLLAKIRQYLQERLARLLKRTSKLRPPGCDLNVIFFHLPGVTVTGKTHGAAGVHHIFSWRRRCMAARGTRAADNEVANDRVHGFGHVLDLDPMGQCICGAPARTQLD